MKTFKDICTGVGVVVISLTGAMACLALSGNARLSITNKDGKVIYDNLNKVKSEALKNIDI